MSAFRSIGARLAGAGAGIWVWPPVLAAVAGLSAAFPERAAETAWFVLENLLSMAPVIGAAVLLSASIRASGADGLLARIFSARRPGMMVVAALFGALTPICGVGVLPIIAGLLGAGVPLAPIMAFWLSSPITDPAMLTITAATLGPTFAIGKTAIAFAVGLIGGFATEALIRAGAFRAPLRARPAAFTACAPTASGSSLEWRFWSHSARRRTFVFEARGSGLMILKWLAVAFALESLLRQYLPPEIILEYAGVRNAWAIPLAVTIGAPIYLDGYAALPLIRGLMDLGMSPGAAMAFLVAGGITSLYASVAVFALIRLPVFLWYLALAVLLSGAGGYAYDAYVAWSP